MTQLKKDQPKLILILYHIPDSIKGQASCSALSQCISLQKFAVPELSKGYQVSFIPFQALPLMLFLLLYRERHPPV